MQFEAVDADIKVTTSPGYGTVGHGDVKVDRNSMTRVVDYSNRIMLEASRPVDAGVACVIVVLKCAESNRCSTR